MHEKFHKRVGVPSIYRAAVRVSLKLDVAINLDHLKDVGKEHYGLQKRIVTSAIFTPCYETNRILLPSKCLTAKYTTDRK